MDEYSQKHDLQNSSFKQINFFVVVLLFWGLAIRGIAVVCIGLCFFIEWKLPPPACPGTTGIHIICYVYILYISCFLFMIYVLQNAWHLRTYKGLDTHAT